MLKWDGIAISALEQAALLKPAASTAANTSDQKQSASTNRTSPGEATQALETKLADARANLAAVEAQAQGGLGNVPPGISLQDVGSRRALLRRLVLLYEQQAGSAAELAQMSGRQAELLRESQAWTGFAEGPPYSIGFVDELHEEVQAEQLRLANAENGMATLDRLVSENQTTMAQAEEKIRQFNERLESPKDAAISGRLSWQRDLERLRSQVAAASVGVIEAERLVRLQTIAEARIRLDWLQRKLIRADAGAVFTRADLELAIAHVESEHQELEHELLEAERRSTNAIQALELARGELRLLQSRPEPIPGDIAVAAERVDANEARLEADQMALRTLRLMLESENVERAMWEMRFAAYDSQNVETLRESERRLKTFTLRLNLWKDYQRQQLEVSSSRIELQQSRIRSLATNATIATLAQEKLTALRERDAFLLRLVRRIEQVQRLSMRWGEGIRMAEERLPFLSRVRDLFFSASTFLEKLWRFELFTAEDTITVEGQKITGKRSVTLGKILTAVLILGLGIWVTGIISQILEPIIVRRLKIEPNQARLIRRWLRALMIVSLAMFSLVSVKIPLTVFAFAGGALAIGLGFGTQTMLKNFVSGLILLFERPFRVGDVLEVAGNRGTVTEIGLRASVLQLWDGTETLIPNSSLLENNVSNWTYSNRRVRFSVTVGAAYGSDTRRVLQLLAEVAARHGVVVQEPKPQALFTDFGDNALMFELRYWVDVIKANSSQVSSDLRQMIAGAFADNGIVIAFPQRDVHLDSARPISVQIVPTLEQLELPGQEK